MTESELQSSIKKALLDLGYTAKTTSNYMRNRRGAKEKGIPDVLVTHRRWERGIWLGLEVKLPKGRMSPDQDDLLKDGRIYVVTSIDEAVAACGLVGVA